MGKIRLTPEERAELSKYCRNCRYSDGFLCQNWKRVASTPLERLYNNGRIQRMIGAHDWCAEHERGKEY